MSGVPEEQEGDCVECNVFAKGICLKEFKEFDTCFEQAQAAGKDEAECMHKFDAFRSCYATSSKKATFNSIMQSAMRGRSGGA